MTSWKLPPPLFPSCTALISGHSLYSNYSTKHDGVIDTVPREIELHHPGIMG